MLLSALKATGSVYASLGYYDKRQLLKSNAIGCDLQGIQIILKLSHFQALTVKIKTKRSDFFEVNGSRI